MQLLTALVELGLKQADFHTIDNHVFNLTDRLHLHFFHQSRVRDHSLAGSDLGNRKQLQLFELSVLQLHEGGRLGTVLLVGAVGEELEGSLHFGVQGLEVGVGKELAKNKDLGVSEGLVH